MFPTIDRSLVPSSKRESESHTTERSQQGRTLAVLIAAICLPFVSGGACPNDGGGGDGSAAGVTGISRTPSSELSVSMYANMTGPDEALVSVRFCCESDWLGGDDHALGRGESLTAIIDGRSSAMSPTDDGGGPIYRATLPASPGSHVEVVHARADGSVVRSEISIVPEFEVTYPRPGEVFDVTDEIVLEWTPAYRQSGRSPAVQRIWLRVECQRLDGVKTSRSFYWQVLDKGQFIYDLGHLSEATRSDLDRDVDCTIDFDFSRTERTALYPPYKSGTLSSSARWDLHGVILRL